MRNPFRPWKVLTLNTTKPIVDIGTYMDTKNFLSLRAQQDLNLATGEERQSEDDSDFGSVAAPFEAKKSTVARLPLPLIQQQDKESAQSSRMTDESFRIIESARSDMLPHDLCDESNLATHEIQRSVITKNFGNVEQLHRSMSLQQALSKPATET